MPRGIKYSTSYNDEWALAKIGYMSETATLEGQQESLWCWVTASRMFAKHYYPSVSLTQAQALYHINGSTDNVGGGLDDIESAIAYYISNIQNANLTTTIQGVYSEGKLKQFLDNGKVIITVHRYYSSLSVESDIREAHMILIYGYVTINGQYYYLIRDSLPEDAGSSYMMSHDELYFRDNPSDTNRYLIWIASVVELTEYADSDIPNYIDRNL